MNTQNEVKNEQKSIESIVSSMKEKTPDFEITLDELEKQTGLLRGEVVRQVRSLRVSGVKYKVGRKGHKSVLLGGQKAKDFKANTNPTTQSTTRQPKNTIPVKYEAGSNYRLNIDIGDKSVSLPLHVEVVPA